jgi:alcohol dehydrogenase class IV
VVAWLRELADELAVPPLSAYGVTAADVERVVGPARKASSMQGNPVALTDDELVEILLAAI